mgnify:FL=1
MMFSLYNWSAGRCSPMMHMRLYTHGVDKRGEGGVGTLCAKSQCGGCHIVYGGIVLVAGANTC